MGLLTSALQIGRSALLSYQSTLQIVGNNISNAGSPDYTRQSPGLSPINGGPLPEGMRPGAGVALTSLKRNLDEALENRLRAAIGSQQSLDAKQDAFGLVEPIFDPFTGAQLPTRLTDFFNSMSEIQNAPTDPAARDLAITAASALASSLRQLRGDLAQLAESINDQFEAAIDQANALTQQIAGLNVEIVKIESGGAPASALRDQRDAALRQLSKTIGVSVRLQRDGVLNVYVGNETIVQAGVSRGIKVVSSFDGEFRRTSVAFADNNARINLRSGRLHGLQEVRDKHVIGRIAGVDQLAATIISEVNKIHSDGQGLTGFAELTATRSVLDPAAVLNSEEAGLSFPPINGSFYLAVTDDATGTTTSYQIEIDLDGIGDDTTLESLVADINDKVTGVTAGIDAGNHLTFAAAEGTSFTFGHDGQTQRLDSSNVLAALGINTLFDGVSAADITVNSVVAGNPVLLAASGTNHVGDGSNVGRLGFLGDDSIETLGEISIMDFFNIITSDVAAAAASIRDDAEASATIRGALESQKENISGVSLDEEAIELIKFERAFQGAARFIGVVDRLLAEMIATIR